MEDSRAVELRLRCAEMEIQFARSEFDGSTRSRQRYSQALNELELAQRLASRVERGNRSHRMAGA
jgi:hypothetical protein